VSDLNISIETRMHQINVYISHNSRFCFTRNYKKEMIRNLFNISPSVMEKSRNIIFIIHLVCRYVLSTINSFICFTTTSKHFNIYFFLLRHFSYNQLFYFFVKLRIFFFCIPSYISLQILNSYCRSLKKIKIKKKRKTKANKTTQNKTKQKTYEVFQDDLKNVYLYTWSYTYTFQQPYHIFIFYIFLVKGMIKGERDMNRIDDGNG